MIYVSLTLLLLLLNFAKSEIPSYNCTIKGSNNNFCVLSNIILTKDDPHFLPIAPNATLITDLMVQQSTLPKLTSDICDNFHQLKSLDLSNNSIEVISPQAFYNCALLKFLYIEGNRLQELPEDTFKQNPGLQFLHAQNNRLRKVENGLLKGLLLRSFNLRANNLSCLSDSVIKTCGNVEIFSLEDNQLLDVNLELMVDTMKNLKIVRISGNFFMCGKMKEMVSMEVFQKGKIFLDLMEPKANNCLETSEWEKKYEEAAKIMDCKEEKSIMDYFVDGLKYVGVVVAVLGGFRIVISFCNSH